MSLGSEERFQNLPSEERELFSSLAAEGEEVFDLLEEDPTSMALPPAPIPAPGMEGKKLKRKSVIPEEENKAFMAQCMAKLRKEMLAQGQGGATMVKPTQVRANPPSLFTGKRGSLMFFVSKLESSAKLTNVPEEKWVALGVQHLDERPTKVWDAYVRKQERLKEGEKLSWEDFKSYMMKRYDSTDTVAIARQKLDKVYQGSDSVERYIERFMGLLSDVEVEYEICMQDQLHLFIKGLSAPLKLASTVNPGTGKPFTDIDDLCTYVVKYEASLKSHSDVQGPPSKRRQFHGSYPAVAGAVVDQTPVATPQVQPFLVPYPYLGAAVSTGAGVGGNGHGKIDSRKFIPPDRQCYFCKGLGHEAWQCQAKREWLATKARAAHHTPVHFQPGYYPVQKNSLPVAAPVQGGPPLSLPAPGKFGNFGSGKGKGKQFRKKKKGGTA